MSSTRRLIKCFRLTRHMEARGIFMFVTFHVRRRYPFENAIGTQLTYDRGYIVRLLSHFFAVTPSAPLFGVTNVTIERLGINTTCCVETSLQAVRFSTELVI